MSTYEIIIVISLFASALAVASYNIGKLKAELKQTRERLEKLELGQDAPIGYKMGRSMMDVKGWLIRLERDLSDTKEVVNAIYAGRYNPDQE